MVWRILHGDCLELLRTLEPESIGSSVTDPPYSIGFMNKKWDGPDTVAMKSEVWRLVLQVLKPGAYLVAFGGTRKSHRLMVAIEDAGFVLRDTLMWMYGQGMPKSHNVSKAIDKAAGAEREVVGRTGRCIGPSQAGERGIGTFKKPNWQNSNLLTAPATAAAKQWDGWGTALKPGYEPIVLAQKPIAGTIAGNVLEHGVGALNIDGCRIGGVGNVGADKGSSEPCGTPHTAGRWPPNVALDEVAARLVDEQGQAMGVHSAGGATRGKPYATSNKVFGRRDLITHAHRFGDTGGASRFFYCPKASTAERNAGLGDEQNTHPTVKPIALMRWLVRLVTPPGQRVLDPFCGSGSTGIAAGFEGCSFVGTEREALAVRIAQRRLQHWHPQRFVASKVYVHRICRRLETPLKVY
jgi:site-specific DNA-methyltransferase (adenine-specific)